MNKAVPGSPLNDRPVGRKDARALARVDVRPSPTNASPVLVKANLRWVPLPRESRCPMTTAPTTMPSSIGVRSLPAALADMPLALNTNSGTNNSAG